MNIDRIIKEINNKKVIVDFDGTITNLTIPWQEVKLEIANMLGIDTILDLGKMYLYAQIKNKKEKYLEIIKKAENDGQNFSITSDFFKYLLTNDFSFSICSNNSRETIIRFLTHHNCITKVDNIIGIEDVSFIKPSPEGLLKLVNNHPEDVVFIGDFISDEIASYFANIKFLYYGF